MVVGFRCSIIKPIRRDMPSQSSNSVTNGGESLLWAALTCHCQAHDGLEDPSLSLMLPTHRPPPSIEHLSKLTSSGYHPLLRRFTIRWALLACGILALLYFALPAVGPLVWHPVELSDLSPVPPPPMPPPPTTEEQTIWEPRKNAVRSTFQRAWNGYMARAFPDDELSSISGGRSNK